MGKGELTTRKIAKNVFYSVLAQVISLITSFLLGFIVPKFIDEYQYAYWQTYILYASYVGVLHFGILDGIVLRYSQFDFEELDKKKIRSQFEILFFYLLALSIGTLIIATFFIDGEKKSIILMIGIAIVIKNVVTYTSYTFQMTNRINKYALFVILDRMIFALGIALLLFFKVNDFVWYCGMDLASDLIATIAVARYNHGLYFGLSLSKKGIRKELSNNLSAGFFLMIANFTDNLIIGSAKMIIQWHWNVLVFGKIAFSFSLTNSFLIFIQAISVVLFPSLKRLDVKALPALYKEFRSIIVPLLFISLIFYFPGCYILKMWLPQYSNSLVYLGILLPIIVYLSKTSLLTNNYLKAYRKEKLLFFINVVSLFIGILLFLIFTYVYNNLDAVLYSIVFIVFFQSICSEIIVSRDIEIVLLKEILIEFFFTISFILCAKYLSLLTGGIIYSFLMVPYIIYLIWKIASNRKAGQQS